MSCWTVITQYGHIYTCKRERHKHSSKPDHFFFQLNTKNNLAIVVSKTNRYNTGVQTQINRLLCTVYSIKLWWIGIQNLLGSKNTGRYDILYRWKSRHFGGFTVFPKSTLVSCYKVCVVTFKASHKLIIKSNILFV